MHLALAPTRAQLSRGLALLVVVSAKLAAVLAAPAPAPAATGVAPGPLARASAAASGDARASGTAVTRYYSSKLDGLDVLIREKGATLRRLEAQRNVLNSKGAFGVV